MREPNLAGKRTLPATRSKQHPPVQDICPQCGEADLQQQGGKHKCPVCGYIQPCCNP